jgi:aspartate aminotransferase-like enzyme
MSFASLRPFKPYALNAALNAALEELLEEGVNKRYERYSKGIDDDFL